MDFSTAKHAFQEYLSNYDCNDDKVRLKIVHTYGVVAQSTEISRRMNLSADRVIKMEYWVSYIAYFFDINFRESMDIILENDYLAKTVRRIPYSDPQTALQMKEIELHIEKYMRSF